ncbi:dihydroxyacetone kinase subunit L [Mobiluncus mulieris]|uniref:dihydroxyacetone kinase subunit DhaL n=1 Tax=Mobiluncus mulieris TaxID=2052 RepID=UPI00147001BD|nr:dihydroxyacetone kinase subunit DhaL [Mobiluncus mulieris]NMW63261.1 dihydroxyacetone kinase subunit L [Mobiluncus mulieris]
MGLTTKWVLNWIAAAARNFREKQAYLTDLDAVIGDGDHGENLARGFSAVEEKLSNYEISTPRKALHTTGTVLLAAVGGASGPLLGTAFLRAAKAIPKEATEIDPQSLAMMLVKAAEGIAERGGAEPGGKTMLDAWYPAATNAAAALTKGSDCAEILRVAAAAAANGAQSTLSMTAEKGRASLLGERSIGHLDPGAISTSWILESAAATAQSFENHGSLEAGVKTGLPGGASRPSHLAQDVLKSLEVQIPLETGSEAASTAAVAQSGFAPSGVDSGSLGASVEVGGIRKPGLATVSNIRPPSSMAPRETEHQSPATIPAASVNAPTVPAAPAVSGNLATQAESFQSAALRLLGEDSAQSEDVKAGAQIASALGIDLAVENAAESAVS